MSSGLGTRKRKRMKPTPAMMAPGTMKDRPQLEVTKAPAIREPRMLPRLVWEFHRPMMRPLRPFPNQLAITVTTPGQPDAWNAPVII